MGYVLPPVTSARRKAGCANRISSVQRPFPVCWSLSRTTCVQGFPHAATKIKVDAVHPVRMPVRPVAVPTLTRPRPTPRRQGMPSLQRA